MHDPSASQSLPRLGCLWGNLQPLTSPDPLDPLVVDCPACLAQQRGDLAIAIAAVLPGKLDNIGGETLLVVTTAIYARMALIELTTEFRFSAEHSEPDAGWTAATTFMALFHCEMMARHPRGQREWCWAGRTLNGGARLIDFYDIKIAAGDLSDCLIGFASFLKRRSTATKGPEQLREHNRSKEGIMYHFATTLIVGIIATVLVSGIAFVPTPTEAAKMSKAERVALEKVTAACKAEAKGMKFNWHWRKRQKYAQNCIIRRLANRA